MANNRPSQEFKQKCREDFKNRLEGAIKNYCSNAENRPNVFIPDEALWGFMDKHINFEYNEKDSEYTVSALSTGIITVMGVGRLTKATAGGGAGGAAVGAVGEAGAGAGVGAMIGIVGGPIYRSSYWCWHWSWCRCCCGRCYRSCLCMEGALEVG